MAMPPPNDDIEKAVSVGVRKMMDEAVSKAKRDISGIEKKLEADLATARENISAIENRVEADLRKRTNDIVIRMVTIFSGLFFIALGALVYSAWSATKDVNSQVISLQSSMIGAQSTIRESEATLRQQTTRLAEAQAAIAAASQEMGETTRQLEQIRATTTAASSARR